MSWFKKKQQEVERESYKVDAESMRKKARNYENSISHTLARIEEEARRGRYFLPISYLAWEPGNRETIEGLGFTFQEVERTIAVCWFPKEEVEDETTK
jgi:hypothetical protein